ncbi:hypothetical protein TVNIR_3842 [Thioalkalivibrio nitratireducens DSM 14787]|uniref:Uncharacterized protein n=1 Tax=Thioalkalivibrio nitratireducens (strain DSM 14787 / UNIQEM 213 / ALEN2) TaxID=1255043 RepID=L0E472_THIND|nr:hypothetical protein TVNIR_3842 [Thioalkalivibrio nitratireducens DSM 14787]
MDAALHLPGPCTFSPSPTPRPRAGERLSLLARLAGDALMNWRW